MWFVGMKKMFKKISTFWKMFISSFFIMLMMLFCIYLFQFFIFRNWILNHEKKSIQIVYEQIEVLFSQQEFDYDKDIEIFKLMDVDFIIYDSDKEVLLSNGYTNNSFKNRDLPSKLKIAFDRGMKRIILNAPINFKDRESYIYIQRKIYLYENFLSEIIPIMVVSVFIIIIMSLIAGIYISKKFINRLNLLKITMKNVKEGGVSDRVEILNERDEFDEIGIIFNSMMDEVEKSFNLQKQFVQNVSHELRTPLTILKGHLQMLNRWGKYEKDVLDKSLKIALEETERFIKLVNDLLILSKTENNIGFKSIDESVNVCEIISELIYSFNVLKDEVEINFQCKNEIYIKILKEHLKQLIIIFLDNSIKYCDKDKKIIDVMVYDDINNVIISIRDNGIGIKKQDIDKVTNKFYGANKSKKYSNGLGIGLSIASYIVNFYNGKLEIKSEFGVFTEVLVYFKK